MPFPSPLSGCLPLDQSFSYKFGEDRLNTNRQRTLQSWKYFIMFLWVAQQSPLSGGDLSLLVKVWCGMVPSGDHLGSSALRHLLLWYVVPKSCSMHSISMRQVVLVCLTSLCMVWWSQIFTELNITDLQIDYARFRKESVDHRMSSEIYSWDSHCKFSGDICTRLVSTL